MKTSRKLIFACLCFLVIIVTTNGFGQTDSLVEIIEQQKRLYFPDKRVDYFDYEIDKNENEITLISTNAAALNLIASTLSAHYKFSVKKTVLPDTADLKGMTYGLANVSVCANRSSPSNTAEMVTQMLMGTPMKILRHRSGYYLVRTPDLYLSWVSDNLIQALDSLSFVNWQTSNRLIVNKFHSRAYSSPSTSSLPVSDLVIGNIIQIKNAKGKFFEVVLPDKRQAFVLKKEVEVLQKEKYQTPGSGDDIVKFAKEFTGIPYLWGGSSVKGVDCSGFTQCCYFNHGILLPRDASQQVQEGIPVPITQTGKVDFSTCLKNLKPGDLLFFDNGQGKVTHTGIYCGNGIFIHSSGMVKTSSLDSSESNYDYHVRHLQQARRYIGTNSNKLTILNSPYYFIKHD